MLVVVALADRPAVRLVRRLAALHPDRLIEPAPAVVRVATPTPAASPSAIPSPPRPTAPAATAPPILTPAPPDADPVRTRRPSRPARSTAPTTSTSARGRRSIIETAPGRYTLRFEDFSVRNGPDLYVYLSPDADDYADGALELGTLKATDGAFGYELPAGTDPADFASAIDLVQAVLAPLRGGAVRGR